MAKKQKRGGSARPKRTYTEQDKQNALDAVRQLGSILGASRQCGVPESTLRRWVLRSNQGELAEQKRPVPKFDLREVAADLQELLQKESKLAHERLDQGDPAKDCIVCIGILADKLFKYQENNIKYRELENANKPREINLTVQTISTEGLADNREQKADTA